MCLRAHMNQSNKACSLSIVNLHSVWFTCTYDSSTKLKISELNPNKCKEMFIKFSDVYLIIYLTSRYPHSVGEFYSINYPPCPKLIKISSPIHTCKNFFFLIHLVLRAYQFCKEQG